MASAPSEAAWETASETASEAASEGAPTDGSRVGAGVSAVIRDGPDCSDIGKVRPLFDTVDGHARRARHPDTDLTERDGAGT
ncbi:hypothetical protein GCM10010441_28740 [Kitasatospora paracochleata]